LSPAPHCSGSAFLIPSFAVSVLAFTPTDAGQLLLPSGVLFVGAHFMVALPHASPRRSSAIATVPFGILMIMAAMWMLSGSTSDSGADDMMAAILLRGFGLGFLFLSITLIAFSELNDHNRAAGIGLFNAGRQLGGLIGVAGLQTLIDYNVTANATVLGASVTAGVPAVSERLTTMSTMLAARGMDGVGCRPGCDWPVGPNHYQSIHRDRFRHRVRCNCPAFRRRRARAGHHQDHLRPARKDACGAVSPDRGAAY
jgi:DHA2 family multidrug resistance protein